MKICKVETIPFRIPLKEPKQWARGVTKAAEHILVKIYTDEGLVGVSEAPPRPTVYGESQQSIKFAIDQWLGPMIVGLDPFEIERIWDRFDTIAWNPTAKGALDIGLHDIMGKALNLPCYKFLGCWNNKVHLSWCVHFDSLSSMVKEGREMIEKFGFRALKLKTGMDPKKDVEMVKTMRGELGDEILMYVDANQGYDPFTAIRVINSMAEHNIAMVEEPCPIWDKKGRKRVSQQVNVPLMGDESCFTPAEVKAEIEQDCLRVVSIKTARTGFTLSKKIVHLCEQVGVRNLNGLQVDSSVGTLASAHLCAALKNTNFYYPSEISSFLLLADDFLKEPLVIKNGCLELADEPGLGIEIDEKKLESFKN